MPKKNTKTKKKKNKVRKSSTIITKPYKRNSNYKKEPSSFPKPKEEGIFFHENRKNPKIKDSCSLDPYSEQSLSDKVKKILIYLVIALLFLLFFLISTAVIFYYLENSGTYLETDSNIKEAVVRDNAVYISLARKDLGGITKIKFIFLGEKEYYFETEEISKDYELSSLKLGINDLSKLEKVSAVLE